MVSSARMPVFTKAKGFTLVATLMCLKRNLCQIGVPIRNKIFNFERLRARPIRVVS